jgi:hypothetical protein
VSSTACFAALKLWPDLPRDVQELLFETAVPTDLIIQNRFGGFFTTAIHGRRIRQADTVGLTENHGFGAIHWVARAFAMVVAKCSSGSRSNRSYCALKFATRL